MVSNTDSPTRDIDEATGAFRKLTNDAASRKYRRRSPAGGSSSSDESSKRHLSSSPIMKDERTRKHDDRDDRVSSRSEHGRDSDSRRYSSRSSQGYNRSDGHSRDGKYVDEEERRHSRLSSRSGRDYKERGGDYNRPRDFYHDKEKYHRDRSDAAGRDSRDKYDDRDRYARGRNYRDEKKDYKRSSRDYKANKFASSEESSRKQEDVNPCGESNKPEEIDKNDSKVEYKPKYVDGERKNHDKGNHKESEERSHGESLVKRPKVFRFDGDDPISGSNQGEEVPGKGTLEQGSISMPESAGNLDAAKVAAMKAAELVNKNLIGTGVMTADQKKKLLWGNKKSTSTEESSHRWDSAIFPDRERQEKFNKLMGVKGEVKVEPKQPPTGDVVLTEKQRELQMDLERQYTAGLRRRDGRTVGLGL